VKLHLGEVELKREDAKGAKDIIVENKRFLRVLGDFAVQDVLPGFTL